MIKAPQRLFEKIENKKIKCLTCQRYCEIVNNYSGFCKTRINKKGQLHSLIYGVINGIQDDPIEKKPLYHFFPGSRVLSLGSFGCNFRCRQCLNYWCSWGVNAEEILANLKLGKTQELLEPKKLVELALEKKYIGIAFTYNEPTLWPEYIADCALLAKKTGLKIVFISNGSLSKECLDFLAPVIDAVNIDIKGFYPQTYQKMGAFLGEILKITEYTVNKYKIHTELTTLIIPGINDSSKELEKIAKWIAKNLNKKIPWHLTQFDPLLCPDLGFRSIPKTSVNKMKEAYEIGKQIGLNFVYLWAPLGKEVTSYSDLICPNCKKMAIKRNWWEVVSLKIKERNNKGFCPICGEDLYLKV